MSREEIIAMAREAGLYFGDIDMITEWMGELRRFAELVAAAEREACARVCKSIDACWYDGLDDDWEYGVKQGADKCAKAIIARGQA